MKLLLRMVIAFVALCIAATKRHGEDAPYLWLIHYLIGSGKTRYLTLYIDDICRQDDETVIYTDFTISEPHSQNKYDYGKYAKPTILSAPTGTKVEMSLQPPYWAYFTVGAFTAMKIGNELVGVDVYDWHERAGATIPLTLTNNLEDKYYNVMKSQKVRDWLGKAEEKWHLTLNQYDVGIYVEDEFWKSLGGKGFDTRVIVKL